MMTNDEKVNYLKSHPERIKAKKELNDAIAIMVEMFQSDIPGILYTMIFESMMTNIATKLSNFCDVEIKIIEEMKAEEA